MEVMELIGLGIARKRYTQKCDGSLLTKRNYTTI